MFRSIVVGTDGSASSQEAVRKAAELARLTGAELHVVSAFRPPSAEMFAAPMAEAIMAPVSTTDDAVRREVEHALDACVKELGPDDLHVQTYAVAGGAAQALLDVAENQRADLVVVGSKGMTGARRLLGSVPNNVAHHAPCSVMIVHTA